MVAEGAAGDGTEEIDIFPKEHFKVRRRGMREWV